jgi:dienelactone hydrolase
VARTWVVLFALAVPIFPVVSAATAPPGRVQISVAPRDVLIDARVRINVSGLRAGQEVTLRAVTRDAPGHRWIGEGLFRADAKGRVAVARAPSRNGTYQGRDAMGLFWSMRRAGTEMYFIPPAGPAAITIQALVSGRVLARARFTRRRAASGIALKTLTLGNDGLVGRFRFRPKASPSAAVLLLGGSQGGLFGREIAQTLASRGVPALTLAYFGEPGLPRRLKNIPLEYFEKALRWLRDQPGVDARKVAILGSSRGAEAALLLGSTYPELVRAVIAYVPSSVAYQGWTLKGRPVPAWPRPAATIPVERVAGPILLVSGVEDTVWASSLFAERIAKRRRAYRKPVTSLVFQAAGHGVGTVIPNLPVGTQGGTREGDARARARAWPIVLRLLKRL